MIGYCAAMKKWSFGVLVFSGLVSLGLLLGSPSMLYALDLNNTDEGPASNVAIASVESGVDVQRESTFAVEQNSRRRGWFLALGLVRRNNRCFFLEAYKR